MEEEVSQPEVEVKPEAVQAYAKFMDTLDDVRYSKIVVECPYCKLPNYFPVNKISTLKQGQIFKATNPADFGDHLVQEHSKSIEIAKIMYEILYLDAAMVASENE